MNNWDKLKKLSGTKDDYTATQGMIGLLGRTGLLGGLGVGLLAEKTNAKTLKDITTVAGKNKKAVSALTRLLGKGNTGLPLTLGLVGAVGGGGFALARALDNPVEKEVLKKLLVLKFKDLDPDTASKLINIAAGASGALTGGLSIYTIAKLLEKAVPTATRLKSPATLLSVFGGGLGGYLLGRYLGHKLDELRK